MYCHPVCLHRRRQCCATPGRTGPFLARSPLAPHCCTSVKIVWQTKHQCHLCYQKCFLCGLKNSKQISRKTMASLQVFNTLQTTQAYMRSSHMKVSMRLMRMLYKHVSLIQAHILLQVN